MPVTNSVGVEMLAGYARMQLGGWRGGAAAGGGDARAAAWPDVANLRILDPRGADHAAGGVGHGTTRRRLR
ncbi:hypothetical protein G6F57_023743 [Rhizopus arrhizus]|nr:hypothetical protein G6F57_023743 [Rhizopus arrhizus]